MHVLEAGRESGRPLILLLHGFPELAFSWRKLILPLAEAGFHVVAPDQRGYGRTTGWDGAYDGDLRSFRMINLARDVLGLVAALGFQDVHAVVGHDFGSPVAAYCALIRPDVFRRVVLMSAPFAGPPQRQSASAPDINDALGKLDPPRKHYQWYYSTREADRNMLDCRQGLHAFLRAYYHYKSADWRGNTPFPLTSWSADELAKLPTYYIMNADAGMAETVAPYMPSHAQIDAGAWLSEDELAVYASEFGRTGLQGGLQWYRCNLPGSFNAELDLFAGRSIDIPSLFIAGQSDWGVYQAPGSFERMQASACTNLQGAHLVPGAGHWVQQERPRETLELLQPFLMREYKYFC
jgi:pimeloyl-ACP methyl ester carboxylesterase